MMTQTDRIKQSPKNTGNEYSNSVENLSKFPQKCEESELKLSEEDIAYQKIFKDMLNLIKKSKVQVAAPIHCKRHFLVLGQTGAGKSTLINALRGIKMGKQLVQKLGGGYQYTLQEKQISKGAAAIGNNLSAGTLFTKSYLEDSGYAFWDCPGMHDDRPDAYDLATREMIKQVVEKYSGNLSIILVIEYAAIISTKGKLLSELNQYLQTLFKDKLGISGGVLIVVNKCGDSEFAPKITIKHRIATLSKLRNKAVDKD